MPVPGQATEQRTEHHEAGGMADPGLLLWNSVLVALGMIVFALAARRRLSEIPKGFANFAEWVAESLNRFTVEIIGPGGERYTPLVGTVFLYILLMNLMGTVPWLHSPTSNVTFTLALGMVVFLYVQFEGIRQNGLFGYLRHFMGPMLALSWLIAPVELMSEFIKPFTLAIRLFGNIFGEDVIIVILAGLAAGNAAVRWIPLQFPVLLLSILTDVVQALVFAILTCIYLLLMKPHHGAEGELVEGEDAHAAHAH